MKLSNQQKMALIYLYQQPTPPYWNMGDGRVGTAINKTFQSLEKRGLIREVRWYPEYFEANKSRLEPYRDRYFDCDPVWFDGKWTTHEEMCDPSALGDDTHYDTLTKEGVALYQELYQDQEVTLWAGTILVKGGAK